METVLSFIPALSKGLVITIEITLAGGALATAAAFFSGLGRIPSFRIVRWISIAYIEVFRGTSALVQLFWFYYVLPLFGVNIGAMATGIIVLGLNSGSYGAEVVRGAILAIPKGQREAATALNLSPRQTLWRVILPQAVPAMLPPAGNLLIELLKNTALVSLITIADLTFEAQLLRTATLRTVEIFSIVLVIYFAVALLITAGIRSLEKRLSYGVDRGGIR